MQERANPFLAGNIGEDSPDSGRQREDMLLVRMLCRVGRLCTAGELVVEFDATDKGIIGTTLRKGDHDLAAAIGCSREALLQGGLVSRRRIDIKTSQHWSSV